MSTKKEVLLAQLEDFKTLAGTFEEELVKFVEKDNKSASTRARVFAQDIAKLMKEVRNSILELRKEGETK